MACVCVAGTLQVHVMSWCKQSNIDKRSFEKRTRSWGIPSVSINEAIYKSFFFFFYQKEISKFSTLEKMKHYKCVTLKKQGGVVWMLCVMLSLMMFYDPKFKIGYCCWLCFYVSLVQMITLWLKPPSPQTFFAQKTQADSSAEIPRLLIWLRKQKEKE